MADSPSLFESAINWIRQGYPEGIPPTEFPPLLALLMRVLDEHEVTDVVIRLARDNDLDQPLTEDQISSAITEVTNAAPTDSEINQVASRLASAGWPLATKAQVKV